MLGRDHPSELDVTNRHPAGGFPPRPTDDTEKTMNIENLPATITVEHAGKLLGVSRSSAYRAAARDEIPTIRIGRRLLVPTAKLLAMLGVQSPVTDLAVA